MPVKMSDHGNAHFNMAHRPGSESGLPVIPINPPIPCSKKSYPARLA